MDSQKWELLRNKTRALILRLMLRVKKYDNLEKLGSRFGGWIIPIDQLNENSICYCVGVGDDITFDLELINRLSCNVFAFDPTPKSIEYVERNASKVPNFHFFDIGLWSSNVKMKFFAPKNPLHISHSILNLQNTKEFFVAQCKRLSHLMKELGHTYIDLLKLDIEGAEYEVLESLIEDKLDINIICVEFDQPMPLKRVKAIVTKLVEWKYNLVNIDLWNYTFIKRPIKS